MTRQELQIRRADMKRILRERCLQGALRPGTLAASKRQMAQEFGVSATIAGQVMQELIDERLFYTVPRSGTYVGPRRPVERELFVLLGDDEPDSSATPMRVGFEDSIANLGGSVLALGKSQVELCLASGSLPQAAGVMEWGHRIHAEEWEKVGETPALVCYATLEEEADGRDSVAFDDVDGGHQAAEHLLHLGHRRIAFLGLHREYSQGSLHEEGEPAWSRLREDGWREALCAAGLSPEGLAFYATRPTASQSHPDQVEVARETARRLLGRRNVDAVVTANDRAAQALLEELKREVAPRSWPAIVSFDNDPQLQSEAVTSLRLPWEEIGTIAAELLWARSHGEVEAAPQHRLARMKLIPRLTCRPDWTRAGVDAPLFEHLVSATVSR